MEENDELATFIKRKNKKNVINMKNNPIDFSDDILGHSKATVGSYVPSISEHSQKKIPRASLIPEDTVFANSKIIDLEAPQRKREAREVGIVPGITNRGVIAQKMEEGFSTGDRAKILRAFNYHKIPDIEEITVAPKEFATSIHQEFDEVETALIKNIRDGKVRKYTISTAVEIAKNFGKFALDACMVAAHEVKNPSLIAAFHELHREKISNLPRTEQAKLKLR